MPWNDEAPITIGDETRRARFNFGVLRPAEGPPPEVPDMCSGWAVEVPAVVWMLDKAQAGEASIEDVRSFLLQATAPRSGCCLACDEVGTEEDFAAEQGRCRRAWFEWWNSISPESHPYALNPSRTKIHTWDCRATPAPQPPPEYSRHEWVANAAMLDQQYHEHSGHRLTPEQAGRWASRYRRPPRCKTCAPLLPGAHSGETSDVPSAH